MIKTKQLNFLFSILLATALFAILFYLLKFDPVLNYDDQLLLNPIRELSSLNQYFYKIVAGEILDIQPVRDLFFYIDHKLLTIIPFYSFHLGNLLVWIGCCFFFAKILIELDENKDLLLVWCFILIYALSPVNMSSVAWISAKKHLLSTFFTLWATQIFLTHKNNLTKIKIGHILALYLLACLSQPINLLWPLFPAYWSFIEKKFKQRLSLFMFLGFIGLVILAVNFYYYNGPYLKITAGDGKFDDQVGLGLSLLAIGRYYFLTLFPFDSLPVSHFQGSIKNLIGLFLLFGFILICYKKRKLNPFLFCFVAYFFIPLIPVTYKITRIFCSDTYLVNASIGIYITFFILLKEYSSKSKYIVLISYSIFLASYSFHYTKAFENTDSIWAYAYAKEPSAMSILNLAEVKLKAGQFSEANDLLDQLELYDPNQRFLIKFRADAIYKNSALTDAEKISRLTSLKNKSPIVHLQLALLYSNNSDIINFKDQITIFLSQPNEYITHSYLVNEEVTALIKVACEKNNLEEYCKALFMKFSNKVTFNRWDKEMFENIYYELKTHPNNLIYTH